MSAGARTVAEACGNGAFAITVDLASADGPARMVEQAVQQAGRLDVAGQRRRRGPRRGVPRHDRGRLGKSAAGQRPRGRARDGRGRRHHAPPGRRPDRQRHLGGRAHGAARLRRLRRDQGRGRFADPHGRRGARPARHPGQQPLARHDGHGPAGATEAAFADLAGRNDLAAFKAERTARIPLGRRSDPEEMAARWSSGSRPKRPPT